MGQDNQFIHEHRAKISRRFIQRLANFIHLDRMNETVETSKQFTAVLKLWAEQDSKVNEEVLRGINNQKTLV